MIILPEPIECDWNKGNQNKNFHKHGISDQECEEAFFDSRKKILKDILHSQREERYILLGQTKGQKILVVVFTVRRHRVRVISARGLNRKERKLYE